MKIIVTKAEKETFSASTPFLLLLFRNHNMMIGMHGHVPLCFLRLKFNYKNALNKKMKIIIYNIHKRAKMFFHHSSSSCHLSTLNPFCFFFLLLFPSLFLLLLFFFGSFSGRYRENELPIVSCF